MGRDRYSARHILTSRPSSAYTLGQASSPIHQKRQFMGKFSPLRILQPMYQFPNHPPSYVYSPEWQTEVLKTHFSNRNVRITCSAHLYLHVMNISVIFFGSNPLIILHSFQNNPSLLSYRMNEKRTLLSHNVWKFKSYEIWRHADWEILTNVSDHPVLLGVQNPWGMDMQHRRWNRKWLHYLAGKSVGNGGLEYC